MRILGVDPGSRITGWGMIGGDARRSTLLDCGVIRLGGQGPELADRLGQLHDEFSALVQRQSPDAAAVETPFQGAGARSALQLAHARGAILAVLASSGLPVFEYTPATVKKSVTGSGRASKDQVHGMVRRLLAQPALGASRDLSDALAVALCHCALAGFEGAVRRAEAGAAARRGTR